MLETEDIVRGARDELELRRLVPLQLIPLDLSPLSPDEDQAKRASMFALARRWHKGWESFHGPLRTPTRDELLGIVTEDFVLTYNGSSHLVGIDDCLARIANHLQARIDVTMSAAVLEVGENTAWLYDVHSWSMPDGNHFKSGRYGRLYRRPGEDVICRWEVLQTNPFSAQEFADTHRTPALKQVTDQL